MGKERIEESDCFKGPSFGLRVYYLAIEQSSLCFSLEFVSSFYTVQYGHGKCLRGIFRSVKCGY